MTSWFLTSFFPTSFFRFKKVPFVLLRSSKKHLFSTQYNKACFREQKLSESILISDSLPLPIKTLESASTINLRPFKGPEVTTAKNCFIKLITRFVLAKQLIKLGFLKLTNIFETQQNVFFFTPFVKKVLRSFAFPSPVFSRV